MSRAFVKEDDGSAPPPPPPELPVSAAPNLVTRRGLDLIDERIAALDAELAGADEDEQARVRRDLRYWTLRRASAIPTRGGGPAVGFGTTLVYRRDGGPAETVDIVGEDEADPAGGLIAYTAPVARAMIGAEAGDTVEAAVGGAMVELEIMSVRLIDEELVPGHAAKRAEKRD